MERSFSPAMQNTVHVVFGNVLSISCFMTDRLSAVEGRGSNSNMNLIYRLENFCTHLLI